jgi:nucleoside diphosphate kinase
MELIGKNSITGWRGLLGPTNSEEARSKAPQSIRARFGTDGTMNACHGSDAPETAAQVSVVHLAVLMYRMQLSVPAVSEPQQYTAID